MSDIHFISASIEQYLLSIYRITLHSSVASTRQIADLMNVSLPSVTAQLKKLSSKKGLLNYAWREGASLTKIGHLIALNLIRKHRLAKTFLYKKAGYKLDEIFIEASRLQHAISDRLADSLSTILEIPQLDPHGLPIPQNNLQEKLKEGYPLSEIKSEGNAHVIRLDELNEETLKFCQKHSILPGKIIKMKTSNLENNVHFKIRSSNFQCTSKIASGIIVSSTTNFKNAHN